MATNLKKLFAGKESMKEETKEAKAVKSGKITPKQYVAGEKSEGESTKGKMKVAEKLKSGKMSPMAYAKSEVKKEKK
jgi:hypothetical protein